MEKSRAPDDCILCVAITCVESVYGVIAFCTNNGYVTTNQRLPAEANLPDCAARQNSIPHALFPNDMVRGPLHEGFRMPLNELLP